MPELQQSHADSTAISRKVRNFFLCVFCSESKHSEGIIYLIINCRSGCEVIPYCGFDLHFLDANAVDHHFMCLLAVCLSLENCLFGSFGYFKIGLLFYC